MKENKSLKEVYKEITKILKENDVILSVLPPRPYLSRRGNKEEKIFFDDPWLSA
jgi:hypothetical protein